MRLSKPAGKQSGGAYAQLKSDIVNNVLEPGFTATEPEIALRLGMSRTPVREALIRLAAEGLIEMTPRRGITVKAILAEDMREIYEILGALEAAAASALAVKTDKTDAFLAPLEQAVLDMRRSLRKDDKDAWAEADDRFHRTLMAMHGNARMTALAEALLDQSHRARLVTMPHRQMPELSTREQGQIFEDIKRGDALGVRSIVMRHRARAAEELLPLIEAHGAGRGI